jgi:exodeoxyribonuclease-3
MIIASYNVNGIRSAMKKGFLEWANSSGADVICVQELRATEDQVNTDVLKQSGWYYELYPAIRRGYAGTAILSKKPMSEVRRGSGSDLSDEEGRVISAVTAGVRIFSIYAPSGSSGTSRQEFKMRWLSDFLDFSKSASGSEPVIFCGDFNICHTQKDIHNPKGLSGTSGFLPEEREWFTSWLGIGLADSFRLMNPDAIEYSWWSMRGNARRKNLGWRIDYAAVSSSLSEKIKRAWIDTSPECSDHCPTLVELRL